MKSTKIIHTENREQENALKAFAKALKIKFEVSNESPYDPEFVKKIDEGDKDRAQGKGRKVTLDELNGLWK
ncbi:MAG TPA: hypothetical protein DDY13_07195 [Cytophagales bacterium]|jgi:hypothetical protein|nr:hypothetical protein [Cytophagales bacterium]